MSETIYEKKNRSNHVTYMNLFYKTISGNDQHEVFQDVAQIKQQHTNHDFFHADPNYRANLYFRYDRILHTNPAFHLLRRDDDDTTIDLALNAFIGCSRFNVNYDRFGRNSDWNDE